MKLILLDIDNTLVDRDGAFLRYIEDLSKRFPEELCPPGIIDTIIAADGGGRKNRATFCTDVVNRFPGLCMTPEQLWEDHKKLPDFVLPCAGLKEMLLRLGEQYRIACVSNGSGFMQRAKLSYAGLDGLFDGLFISGETGIAKPDTGIFQRALTWAGASPHEVIMVGDHPDLDIIPAKSLGMKTVWVRQSLDFNENCTKADYTICSIMELERILTCMI